MITALVVFPIECDFPGSVVENAPAVDRQRHFWVYLVLLLVNVGCLGSWWYEHGILGLLVLIGFVSTPNQ